MGRTRSVFSADDVRDRQDHASHVRKPDTYPVPHPEEGARVLPPGGTVSEALGPDDRIRDRAARQFGVVSRRQLLSDGVRASAIDYRLRAKRLTPVLRGIYRVGVVAHPLELETAALLACGPASALSFQTAAALLGLSGYGGGSQSDDGGRSGARSGRADTASGRSGARNAEGRNGDVSQGATVHVSAPGSARAPGRGLRVHRVAPIRADELTAVQGLPVTTPARTLLDLAPVVPARDLEQMLARGLREGAVSEKEIVVLLDRYPGRPGTRRLRTLLSAEQPPAFARSVAEEALLALLRRAGRRPPSVNVRVEGFEVDMFWPRERLVVEMDGRAFHSRDGAFEIDRRRDAALQAKGMGVIRVTWRRLKAEPEAVLADIVEALATGGARR